MEGSLRHSLLDTLIFSSFRSLIGWLLLGRINIDVWVSISDVTGLNAWIFGSGSGAGCLIDEGISPSGG